MDHLKRCGRKEESCADIMCRAVYTHRLDTPQKLEKLVDLILEKALEDPSVYAILCKKIISRAYTATRFCNFHLLLISKCQSEFDQKALKIKVEPAEEVVVNSEGIAEGQEMQLAVDANRKSETNLIGIVKFLDKLRMLNLLTLDVIVQCHKDLAGRTDDESLECLSILHSCIKNSTKPVNYSRRNCPYTIRRRF